MIKKVELTEQEKYVLLNKGNLVSIPKDPNLRNWEAYGDTTIKRIEYIQYSSRIYLRDKNKWYILDKKDIPEPFRTDFLGKDYREELRILSGELLKISYWIRSLFGSKTKKL